MADLSPGESAGPRAWLRRLLFFWGPGLLARKAERHLLAGEHQKARPLLLKALKRARGWAELSYLLGRCEAAAGDRVAEEDYYKRALELNPDHRRAEEGLTEVKAWRYQPVAWAWHLYHGKRTAEALEAFRAALAEVGPRVRPENCSELHAGLGWCYYDLKTFADARACFARAVELEPGLVHAHKGLGLSLYWLQLYDAAEGVLKTALDLNQELDDARSFLGWCSYARGLWDEAMRHFRLAVELNPLAADQQWGVAWCELKQGNRAEALAAFGAAIEAGPAHPSRWELLSVALADRAYRELLFPLGNALLRGGFAADARESFSRLRGLEPGARACTGLALALMECGEHQEVTPLLSELPDAEMDTPCEYGSETAKLTVTPRQLLGRAALASGHVQEAHRILSAVVQGSPQLPLARLDLADACLGLDDLEGAEAQLEKIPRSDPTVAERRDRITAELGRRRREPMLRALEALKRGEAEASLQLLDAAPAPPEQDRWKSALLRGRILMQCKRLEEAETAFGRSLACAPENPQPLLWRARALRDLGRKQEAYQAVHAAIERHPEHVDLLFAGASLAKELGRERESRNLNTKARRLAPGSRGAWLPEFHEKPDSETGADE